MQADLERLILLPQPCQMLGLHRHAQVYLYFCIANNEQIETEVKERKSMFFHSVNADQMI